MRDRVFIKLFFGTETKVTEEEVSYFRLHPDEIDEFSAPLSVHKFFLMFGTLLGVLLLSVSKVLKFYFPDLLESALFSELLIDLVFETGVALIGASVTAYLLGVLLNRQQSNAKKWRSELRKKIKQSEK